MHKIGSVNSFLPGSVTELDLAGWNLLLVNQDGQFYLVENKCGHFGIPLKNAEVTGSEITCLQHGIRFSMVDGEVKNRKYENCDKLKTFKVIMKDNELFFENR